MKHGPGGWRLWYLGGTEYKGLQVLAQPLYQGKVMRHASCSSTKAASPRITIYHNYRQPMHLEVLVAASVTHAIIGVLGNRTGVLDNFSLF